MLGLQTSGRVAFARASYVALKTARALSFQASMCDFDFEVTEVVTGAISSCIISVQ